MPWVRIEDTFYDHPKVLAAGLASIGLHVVALCYCNSKLTDGAVPRAAVRLLGGTTAQASRLVTAGLWEATEDGWKIHDFLDYNPSRASVLEHRQHVSEERAKAGRIGGIAAAIAKQRASKPSANGQQPDSPIPSQPNPSHPDTDTARDEIGGMTDVETDLFAYIAQQGAFIRPESGLGQRLVGLIDRRGVEVVMDMARKLTTDERLSDRQWVFALEKALEAIPSPPMDELPTGPDPRAIRRQERVDAARLEYFQLTGKWDPNLGPEPEWREEWGPRPRVAA